MELWSLEFAYLPLWSWNFDFVIDILVLWLGLSFLMEYGF